MKRIAILGSTGSIGRSTLNVIENNPERFQLLTMAAGSNVEAALNGARRWKPKVLSWPQSRMRKKFASSSRLKVWAKLKLFTDKPAQCGWRRILKWILWSARLLA